MLFILPQAKAQINFVPNPSFEDTVICPQFLDNMPDVQDWSSFGNSADYFNSCSAVMNVPNAVFGFQPSHSGSAYCGVVTYFKGNSVLSNNYREFIGVHLLNSLQIEQNTIFHFMQYQHKIMVWGFLVIILA